MNTIDKNDYIHFSQHNEELVKKYFPAFILKIRASGKLPQQYDISDDELMSELTYQAIRLSKSYDCGKNTSYIAYLCTYIIPRTIDAIWSEYKKIDHTALEDAIKEFEDGYDYTESKQYIRYEMDRAKSNESKKQDQLLVNDIMDIVTGIDFIICNLVMDGKTNREIAKIVGMDHKTIGNRLHKIARMIKVK